RDLPSFPTRRSSDLAARYRRAGTRSWWDDVEQHGGLALSYLNYYDADAAWLLVHDLGIGPACAIIKHANPCGVSVDADLATAYQDRKSTRLNSSHVA